MAMSVVTELLKRDGDKGPAKWLPASSKPVARLMAFLKECFLHLPNVIQVRLPLPPTAPWEAKGLAHAMESFKVLKQGTYLLFSLLTGLGNGVRLEVCSVLTNDVFCRKPLGASKRCARTNPNALAARCGGRVRLARRFKKRTMWDQLQCSRFGEPRDDGGYVATFDLHPRSWVPRTAGVM